MIIMFETLFSFQVRYPRSEVLQILILSSGSSGLTTPIRPITLNPVAHIVSRFISYSFFRKKSSVGFLYASNDILYVVFAILEEIPFDWCDFVASAICVFPVSGILYSHTIYPLASKSFDL